MRRLPRPRIVLAWPVALLLLLPEAKPFGLNRRSGPCAALRGLFRGLGFVFEECSAVLIELGGGFSTALLLAGSTSVEVSIEVSSCATDWRRRL